MYNICVNTYVRTYMFASMCCIYVQAEPVWMDQSKVPTYSPHAAGPKPAVSYHMQGEAAVFMGKYKDMQQLFRLFVSHRGVWNKTLKG